MNMYTDINQGMGDGVLMRAVNMNDLENVTRKKPGQTMYYDTTCRRCLESQSRLLGCWRQGGSGMTWGGETD